MTNLLVWSIIIMPFVCVPLNEIIEQFRMPKAVFFDFICMGIICIAIKNGLKFQYKNKYLAILAGWVFFIIFWNWYSPQLFAYGGKVVFNLACIESYIHFILGLFATLILCSTLERPDFIRIAKAICIASILTSILGVMQGLNFNPLPGFLHMVAGNHVSTLIDNPSLVGNYVALSIPFFLYINERKYYLCLPIVLACLYFCQSDISNAVTFIGITLYYLLVIQNKWLTRVVLVLVLLGLIIIYLHPHLINLEYRFNHRMEVWSMGWDELVKNPLFGRGLGSWKTFVVVESKNYFYEAHNDWLERTIELGFVGLFFIILLVVNSFRSFNYNKSNRLGIAYLTCFVMFLLLMGGSFVMEMAAIGLTGLLGFIGVEKLKET